jgi:hypothetical protein
LAKLSRAAEQDAEIVAKWLHDYGYYLNKAAQEAAADENKEEEKRRESRKKALKIKVET